MISVSNLGPTPQYCFLTFLTPKCNLESEKKVVKWISSFLNMQFLADVTWQVFRTPEVHDITHRKYIYIYFIVTKYARNFTKNSSNDCNICTALGLQTEPKPEKWKKKKQRENLPFCIPNHYSSITYSNPCLRPLSLDFEKKSWEDGKVNWILLLKKHYHKWK